jgi:DNA helicase-4
MTQTDEGFRYQVGALARFLGMSGLREIALAGDQLLLTWARGRSETLLPDQVAPPIRCFGGIVWSTVRFRLADGRSVRLAGIRRGEAAALARLIEEWIAPARTRYFVSVETELAATEAQLTQLLDESKFVRQSDATQTADRLQSACRRIAGMLDVADRPESLWSRHAKLKRQVAELPALVGRANEGFVAAATARHEALFDTVEAKPLTAAQRLACVVDDDYNLVLAGAGTGKTSVMIGRAGYLLAEGLARPESMLLVAYNREAAEELRERAVCRLDGVKDVDRLTIKTFHALGLELIAEAEGVRPSVSVMATDGHALARFVTEQLEELLQERAYAARFIEYGFDRHEAHRSIFDFATLEEYERELARLDLRTLRGERVKSHEELRIANFLTRNGIAYRYEEPFPIDTASRDHRQYRPDFTILREEAGAATAKDPLYLEHFGVDSNGNPPPFFGEASAREYRAQMGWKRDLYRTHQLPLIETYSFEFESEVVFKRLVAKLAAHGVVCRYRTEAECLEMLRNAGIVSETAQFMSQLVPLVREHPMEPAEMRTRIAAMPEHERARAALLWELVEPVVRRYEQRLAERGEVDFAEMIRRATRYVQDGRVRSPYTHLLVDEFQDISGPRAELILALARSRGGSSVFCVGDDWQSIYRFAGSDIRYTSQFVQRVGRGTTTALDRTFRFNDQVGAVASRFVMRNPEQVRKEITSQAAVSGPAVSLVRTADPSLALEAVLGRIQGWAKQRASAFSVYVLARYWYQLESIERAFAGRRRGAMPGISSLRFSTVHAAKGLEADFVVIVGLEEGRNGFPADKPADAFAEMFLPPPEAYPFAEERRLLYVALTRARHRVYLLYDAVTHSPFIRELMSDGYPIEEHELGGHFIQEVLPVVRCPRCETGEIRPRAGEVGRFYSCHRYPACRYRERGCGACGGLLLRVGDYCVCSNPHCDGVHLACPKCRAPMERRSGPHGAFFGCSNFGRVDLIEQCAATLQWRPLPTARELRSRSGVQT